MLILTPQACLARTLARQDTGNIRCGLFFDILRIVGASNAVSPVLPPRVARRGVSSFTDPPKINQRPLRCPCGDLASAPAHPGVPHSATSVWLNKVPARGRCPPGRGASTDTLTRFLPKHSKNSTSSPHSRLRRPWRYGSVTEPRRDPPGVYLPFTDTRRRRAARVTLSRSLDSPARLRGVE